MIGGGLVVWNLRLTNVLDVFILGLGWSLSKIQTWPRSLGPLGGAVITHPDEWIRIRFCPFLPYENSLRLEQSWFSFSPFVFQKIQTWLKCYCFHRAAHLTSKARLKPSRSPGTRWHCRTLWICMLIFVFTFAADADWQSIGLKTKMCMTGDRYVQQAALRAAVLMTEEDVCAATRGWFGFFNLQHITAGNPALQDIIAHFL